MEELIERLKSASRAWVACPDLCKLAADGITRLRAEVEAMTKERDALLLTPPDKREDLRCVISDLCHQLREEKEATVQALAACRVKDEALKYFKHCACNDGDLDCAAQALAIQPNSDSLQAWFKEQLGEPVGHFEQEYVGGPVLFYQVNDSQRDRHGVIPLYAPKGVK